MSWQEELDDAFQEAREDLGFPPIDRWAEMPEEKKEMMQRQGMMPTAFLDMSRGRNQFKVNPEFIDSLSFLAKKGVCAHELGHQKKHPGSAKTAIMENHWSKEYENSNSVTQFFDDLVNNTSLIMQARGSQAEELESLYKEMSENGQTMVENLIRKRYEEVADIRKNEDRSYDFGSTIQDPDGTEKELLRVLQSIDFRRNPIIEDHEFYFHKFASSFDPYLGDDSDSPPSDIGGDMSLDSFPDAEIEDAVDEIARDDDINAEEFEDILEDTSEDTGDLNENLEEKLDNAVTTFYDSLSRQYNLKIKGKVANRVGTAPNGHKDWEIGDRSDLIDPENSLGKIGMPGVTKTRKMAGYEMHGGQAEGKPDAIILMDSSGSMQNPREDTSYAVLGAYCAANSYIENGSEVAVANFSNQTEATEFTKDRTEVQKALADYQSGTTNLDTELVQELDNQKPEPVHSILITDADIRNFDDTVNYLENSSGRNTMLWIDNENHDELPDEYSELENIPDTSIYHIKDESDIPDVVLGEVR